jgi:hypothetical protein
MGKRGVVTDYAGEELYKGDLVAYAARQGNRVRMTDAIVLEVTAKKAQVEGVGFVLVPTLKVQPTGDESGFTARKTTAAQWIAADHVRLITPGAVPDEE